MNSLGERKENSIKILQYNTQKSNNILSSLLNSREIQEFDILAIQEPWENPRTLSSSYSSLSLFLPLFNNPIGLVSFYIHSRIKLENFSFYYLNKRIGVLKLNINNINFNILNLYLPATSIKEPERGEIIKEILSFLKEFISRENTRTIILGDFNLKHPSWTGKAYKSKYSQELLDLLLKNSFSLTLPKGERTWNRGEFSSTIDLTFISSFLEPRFLNTTIREDLDLGSDHFPIETTLLLDKRVKKGEKGEKREIRDWKKIDKETLIESFIRNIPLINKGEFTLLKPEELDIYISKVLEFINILAKESTPLIKNKRFRNPWWNKEISLLIKEARKKRRLLSNNRISKEEYKETLRKKEKAIRLAKDLFWRKEIETLSKDPKDYWKYARFSRDKLGKPPELPKIPTLVDKENNYYSSYSSKIDILASSFYPSPLEANLEDITSYPYPPSLPTKDSLLLKDIYLLLNRLKIKSALGIDKIPNIFLKLLGNISYSLYKEGITREDNFNKSLLIIINSSWKFSYFPSSFKRAKSICLRKPGKDNYTTPKAYRPIALLNTLGKVIELATSLKLRDLAEENNLLPPI